MNSPNSAFMYPKIPQSGEDIRRQYGKGKVALLNLIPSPPSSMLKAHAVGCLVGIVRDFLAHGIPSKSVASVEWQNRRVVTVAGKGNKKAKAVAGR
jgi:hypothetical protein